MLDLGGVPVVDNHCHSIVRGHATLGVLDWQGCFTEAGSAAMRHRHAGATLAFRRTARLLAAELGVESSGGDLARAVADARSALGDDGLGRRLLRAANAAAFLLDDGYPTVPHYTDAEFAALSGATVARVARLEPILERVLPAATGPDDARDRLLAHLDDLGGDVVALKSAIAYRTGLDIATWDPGQVAASFGQARRDAERNGGRLRLNHRPVHEHLLRAALRWAAAHRLPVQFHTGYGDADLDLRLANPAHLRPILADPALRGLTVVLLHGCWPYTREGAFLAALYEGVYLDLSYAIPFLSTAEMRAMTRAALSATPTTKLLYSSDGVIIPDLHWSAAHTARRILGVVLAETVTDGDLTHPEAEEAARAILSGNARELYRL